IAKATLGLRVPVGRAAIGHIRDFAEDAEAVSEPVRTVDLAVVLIAQLEGLPLTELGRANADVDDDVDDRAPNAAHELAHSGLVVHAPNDTSARARVVVLDELLLDP